MLHGLPKVVNKLRYRRGGIPPEMLFSKIPGGVRLAGEKAMLDYLSNHDLSHVVSVKHNAALASNPDNVLFEPTAINRARGAADMTAREQWAAVVRNATSNVAGARVLMTAAAKGAALGMLMELPVTATVETLHVINHNKPVKRAVRDAAKTVGMSGLFGGETAGVLTLASAFGMPLCRPMGDGLWEIRTELPTKRTARVLLCLYRKHLVVLHGFIKKTRATPDSDLAMARKRRKELER